VLSSSSSTTTSSTTSTTPSSTTSSTTSSNSLWFIVVCYLCVCVCVCVCVNSTSGGERSLATPAYQGRLALVLLPLGAAVNKIKSATLTLPNA
jgi:hypothetical protein